MNTKGEAITLRERYKEILDHLEDYTSGGKETDKAYAIEALIAATIEALPKEKAYTDQQNCDHCAGAYAQALSDIKRVIEGKE